MKKNLTYLLMSVFLFGACTGGKQESVSLTLNVKQALSNPKRFDIDREAKQIDFVALETRQECMVGELMKVVKSKDHLFVADFNANLYLFDTQGKFIRRIGAIGQGVGEYVRFFDFDVDPKTDDVYLNVGGKLLVYSVDGQFQKSIELGPFGLQVFCLNSSGRVMSLWPDAPCEEGVDSVELVQTYDLATGEKESIKSGVVRRAGIYFFGWIYSKSSYTYYKPELGNCIYRLDPDNRKTEFLELDFGDLAFTTKLFHYEAMAQWDNHYRLYNFMNFKNHMVLNLQKGLMGKELVPLVYDRVQKEFFCPQGAEGKNGLYVEDIPLQPLTDEGQNLICSISMVDALKQKESIHNGAFKAALTGVDENSNPVLAICEF